MKILHLPKRLIAQAIVLMLLLTIPMIGISSDFTITTKPSTPKSIYEVKINIEYKNMLLVAVLKDIEQKTSFLFTFDENDNFLQTRINKAKGKYTVAEILESIDGVIYQQVNNNISIRKNTAYNNVNSNQVLERTITGRVTDEKGEGIPSVNVVIKGTVNGTTTELDGKYTLNVPNNQSVLVFSSVGYIAKEVAVNDQTIIDVFLASDTKALDEVVVVGFGTQKKVNLTGAVASVSSADLEKRTVTKASQALQGQMSGISIRQSSGNPSGNSGSMIIRGNGTFSGAGNNPLVLVDGIESSIDNVDPADIESVSVLKDAASASIFGSKAANGVILIETKKGVAGKPVVNYNMYVGKASATMLPEMLNSWEYAEAVNEAYTNSGQQPRYTADEIQKFKNGTDPNYPNFDHIGYLFGSGSGIETKHDISMRGGTEQTQYMFSTGYYRQNGLIDKNYANRYNVRLNLDTKLSNKLKFNVRLSAIKNKTDEPSSPYSAGLGGIVAGAMRNSNALHGPTPDGFWGRNEVMHPEADLNSKSFVKNESMNIYGNSSLIWNPIRNLKITGQVGYTHSNSEYKGFIATYPITPTYAITRNSLNTSWGQSTGLTLQSMAEYAASVKNHNFNFLAGVMGQQFESRSIGAYRDEFPNNNIYEIDAGSTTRGTQSGSATRNTLASYFGRVNYNFDERYLLEANFRYDGSSRFPANRRWGFFPSFSAGWRISQEAFFEDLAPWVSDLKLRASWGRLGNQSIGNYPYQDLIALGQNYPFGNALQPGAAVSTIANKNITWESTSVTNIGLDVALLANRLNFTAEYFVKTTSDILYNVSVSNMLGASPSATNAGAVQNKGWDFNLKYRGNAGDFTYGASAVFSIVRNKVTKLATLQQDINRGLFVGHPIGSAYGFTTDGLFVDQNEVDNYAKQPFAFLSTPGGIKLRDLSGPDGTPDGIVDNTYDRRVIGMPLPITTYGLSLNAGYKSFDLSLFLQGEGGRRDMVTLGQFFFPLENNGNVQRDAFENRWSPANPDPNAAYPKMAFMATGFYNTNRMDFWYKSATFLRLKNAQIGYTLPKTLLEKTFLESVRVYASGENLFTLTGYYKGWDPEMATGTAGWFYPLAKLYVVGLNIRF